MNKSRLTAFLLFFTIFLDIVGTTLIFPLVPFLLNHYFNGTIQNPIFFQKAFTLCEGITQHLNPQNAHFLTKVLFGGVLGSIYSLAQYFSAPILGKLSDKIGRKKVLLIALMGTSLGYLPWFFAKTFGGLFLTQVLCGIMAGNISVATAAFADISNRKARAKAMALSSTAFSMGFIFGPFLGSFLTKRSGSTLFGQNMTNPFYLVPLFAALLALGNFFLCFFFFRETQSPEMRTIVPKGKKKKLLSLLFPKIFSRTNPILSKTNLTYLLFSAIFSGIDFTLTFLAVERLGFDLHKSSLIFVYLGIIVVLSQLFLLPFLLKHIHLKTLVLIGISCGALSFFFISLAHGIGSFFIGLTLLALSAGFVFPGMAALASLYAAENKQGYSIGLFRSSGALARTIAPMLAAILYFLYGARFYYLLGAVGMLLPLWLLSRLPKPVTTK